MGWRQGQQKAANGDQMDEPEPILTLQKRDMEFQKGERGFWKGSEAPL